MAEEKDQHPENQDDEQRREEEFAEEVFEEESPSAAQEEGFAGEAPETADAEDGATAEEVSQAVNSEATREDKLLEELQRLAAEYKNYRQRTESQWDAVRARAVGDAAKRLFPVLDDLERAEQHGDLVEGSAFAAIASKIRTVVTGLGVTSFGEAGEAFDPKLHEAVLQQTKPDVETTVVGQVVEPGYKVGDTLLRAAKVVVFAPQE